MAEPDYLPSAVRRQAQAAEEIVAQNGQEHTPEPPAPDDTPEPPAPASADTNQPQDPKPFDIETASEDELRAELRRSQQRFSTLQGKYRAEVPRLSKQVSDLKSQLSSQEARVAELEAQGPGQGNSQERDPDNPHYQYLVEEFGEDAAKHMLSLVKPDQTPQPPQNQTTPQVDTNPQPTDNSEQERHEARLAELQSFVDDVLWEGAFSHIDNNEQFHGWLAQDDLREGTTRSQALRRAFDAGDIHKVAGFWVDYANLMRVAEPSPPADPRETLVDVDAQNAGGEIPEVGPDMIAASEVLQFYKDVSLGKYRGREDERKQREAEIMAATAAGKIFEDTSRVEV